MNPDWRPEDGPTLTEVELLYLTMSPIAISYKGATVNGKNEYRTVSSQSNDEKELKNNNSVVKTWSRGPHGGEVTWYGTITAMYDHGLYPGGPRHTIVECEWYDTIPPNDNDPKVYLPQVQKNPQSDINRTSRVAFLNACAHYNIFLGVHDPNDANCDVYDVVDRYRIYEDKQL